MIFQSNQNLFLTYESNDQCKLDRLLKYNNIKMNFLILFIYLFLSKLSILSWLFTSSIFIGQI